MSSEIVVFTSTARPHQVEPLPTRRKFVWPLVILAGVIGCGATLTGNESSFAAQLEEGCESVAQCRQLTHGAAARLKSCSLACGEETEQHSHASLLLKDALEAEALRKSQQRNERFALRRQEALSAEREHSRQTRRAKTRAQEVATEREHQRQLELLTAQAEQQRLVLAQRAEERLAYLKRLSSQQKLARLDSCHREQTSCDELAAQLVTAAGSGREKRAIVNAHERFGHAPEQLAKPLLAETHRPTVAPAASPAQCCDGSIGIGCNCGDDSQACCSENGGSCGCVGG